MAVDHLTAPLVGRAVVRTCIGCRRRASATELLRVVAVPGTGQQWHVTADPRRQAPGRGASVHPDPICLSLAERRRAYARALRIPVAVDASAVAEYVESIHGTNPARIHPNPAPIHPGGGSSRKREEAAMSPR